MQKALSFILFFGVSVALSSCSNSGKFYVKNEFMHDITVNVNNFEFGIAARSNSKRYRISRQNSQISVTMTTCSYSYSGIDWFSGTKEEDLVAIDDHNLPLLMELSILDDATVKTFVINRSSGVRVKEITSYGFPLVPIKKNCE